MTADIMSKELSPDQLAFYFKCEGGVGADALGKFMQRAATVAKREGVNLQVLATRDGSLAIIARVVKRSGSAVGSEFGATPLKTSAATTVLVTAVVAAISHAMSPDSDIVTPLAKAGARLVEENGITSIELVTKENTIQIMDHDRAISVLCRSKSVKIESVHSFISATPVVEAELMAHKALEGMLAGTVLVVAGKLYFGPDDYRYLVPIDFSSNFDGEGLVSGGNYRVRGKIIFRGSSPDHIIINSASQT